MRLSVAAAVACLILIGLSAADESQAAIKKYTNIPAEDLGLALQTLAKDRGFQVVYVSDEVRSLRTHGASGDLTPQEALTQLLQGTGLTYRYLNDNGVSIVQINDTPPPNTSGAGPATPSVQPLPSTDGKEKEVEKGFLDRFRLAQADQGTPSGPSPVEKQKDQASKKKAEELEEIIVTGTRIPQTAQAGAQDVKVYTREKIEQSGQTTIADFLNTLPDVSTNIGESGIQTQQGITTVSLHGLPLGTTLVLLNGRRVEASGVGAAASGSDFFDLNNIPLAAVERIEVVSEGSSAIYGSDAIAGVVNIILKSGFDGIEASTKYGSASGTDESDTSIAWGKRWSDGALSVIGSYQTRGQLIGFDRAITANNDYLPFGGVDARIPECNPGEAFTLNGSPLPGGPPGNTASFAAVSANASGNPRQTGFMGHTACSINAALMPMAPSSPRRIALVCWRRVTTTCLLPLSSSPSCWCRTLRSSMFCRHRGCTGIPGSLIRSSPSPLPIPTIRLGRRWE